MKESYRYNFGTGRSEYRRKPCWRARLLEWLGTALRIIGLVAIIIILLVIARSKYVNEPPFMDIAEAKTVLVFEEEHATLEFYVSGQRYVRKVLKSTIADIAEVAKEYDMNQNHLLAICLKEGVEFHSGQAWACSPTAVGDNGRAIGAFQILAKYHGMPVDDAKNIIASARWTAERMLRYGYRDNPKYAMMSHNGVNSFRYGDSAWQVAKTLHTIS